MKITGMCMSTLLCLTICLPETPHAAVVQIPVSTTVACEDSHMASNCFTNPLGFESTICYGLVLVIIPASQGTKCCYDIHSLHGCTVSDFAFVYKGIDYSNEVLVRQLLNHTSGIADYWEDKPIKGKSIKEMVVEEPERFWKPEDTIDHTRYNQKAVSSPGKKFHYSDTGYNLLGKIIEAITQKPFHENLKTEIFNPLGMDHSYLLYRGGPNEKSTHPILDTYIGEHEVSGYKSISADWAGGGVVTTTEDLLLFHKALVNHTLIHKETLELCSKDTERWGFGMDYGYGILFLNIGKMVIFQSEELNMWGNFGSIGAYMFYNPAYDVYIIGSFDHSKYMRRQIRFIIFVIRTLSKM